MPDSPARQDSDASDAGFWPPLTDWRDFLQATPITIYKSWNTSPLSPVLGIFVLFLGSFPHVDASSVGSIR